ncbi:MAG TPA: hypothetical protein VJ910_00705 [Desulfuromonadales bacterium]|nr:hypothetical protein [Desulfuromonadales bacterium]
MIKRTCLNDQDLTLLHYDETSIGLDPDDARRHLAECAACRARQLSLERVLHGLPRLDPDLDPHHATRMAARVKDCLPRRRSFLPAMTTVMTAAIAVLVVTNWAPQRQASHNSSANQQATVQQEMPQANAQQKPQATAQPETPPEVDLLENLELLKELDTLSEITGV